MWTETTRHQYRREDLRYASDMTDAEWTLIEPHMPMQKQLGRPRKVQLREVVEALLYILRTACPWRLLPRDFPKRSSVQHYFYAWQKDGLWERINFFLLQMAREREGREASPSAGVIDSQSVKTTESGVRAVTTRAKRSRAASAISSLTPVGIWLVPRCTPLTSKTATGRRGFWPRSAISSLGCVTSLPTALTPARSWKRRLPDSGSGRLNRQAIGPGQRF
jgi:transposase